MAERRSPNSNPIQTGPSNSGNSGNTNSNTSNTSTNNPPSPIPTPPPTSAASSPQTSQKSSKSSSIQKVQGSKFKNIKKRFRSIRQNFNPISEVIDYQVIGDFDFDGSIPLYVDSKEPEDDSIGLTDDRNKAKYPQVKVNVVKYDLSKIKITDNPDINFDFVVSLKDGLDGIPQLWATKKFIKALEAEYTKGRPFGVNDIIEKKNIVVVDIKPLKEKVEALRKKELSINLNRNEIKGQVEVRKNLFVNSNYKVGADGSLEAIPTYEIEELIKYLSWVVSKPSSNYDDRLIPTNELGDFDGYSKEEDIPEDSPSEQTNTSTNENNEPVSSPISLYPPIGRKGTTANETVFKDGKYWEWDGEFESWIEDKGAIGNSGKRPKPKL
tara:strand:- start:60 stop:1205 length:1146 start_codon:yes stop_codon:yes gene_type:complete